MRRLGWIALALAAFGPPALADDGRVRAGLDTEGTIWVGQRVALHVDLMTPAFSFSGQMFHLPQVSGAVLMQDEATTLKLTEQVGGESWQVLRYSFSLFPQRAGEITVPPVGVSFSVSRGYGQPQTDFDLATQPLTLTAKMPPGVSASTVVTTREFAVDVSVDPDTGDLKVGDAITLTVTRRAQDLSGMAFPPFKWPELPGFAVYPKDPQVQDRSDRGRISGERVEQATFVAQEAGLYTLPSLVFNWWDPASQRLGERSFPERTLEVVPNPALIETVEGAAAVAPPEPWIARHPVRASLIVVASVLLLWVSWKLGGTLTERKRRRHADWAESEAGYFHRLEQACGTGRPSPAYTALLGWLARTGAVPRPVTLARFTELHADSDLAREFDILQQSLLRSGAGWSGKRLKPALRRARKSLLAAQHRRTASALPPLN
jgi:hypothetical protein